MCTSMTWVSNRLEDGINGTTGSKAIFSHMRKVLHAAEESVAGRHGTITAQTIKLIGTQYSIP